MAWYSTVEAATVAILGALGVAVGTLFKFRRTFAKDNGEIFEGKQKRAWIEEAFAQHAETRRRLELALDEHDADTHTIGRLEAQVGVAKALEDERARQIAACEERIRSLAEHVLELNITFDKVYAELARLDPDAAARVSVERWRPSGKGPNPP